jgi:hypothetical protein
VTAPLACERDDPQAVLVGDGACLSLPRALRTWRVNL